MPVLIRREIEIQLVPEDLAYVFCQMEAEDQAMFFREIARRSAGKLPGDAARARYEIAFVLNGALDKIFAEEAREWILDLAHDIKSEDK